MKQHLVYSAIILTMALQAHSQVLPIDPLAPVLPQVTERVQRSTEQLQQQALQQQQLTKRLAEQAALPDPLTVLPDTLEVLSQSGQLRWREVEVEQGFRAIEREWLLLLSATEWQSLQTRWPQLSRYLQSSNELDALGLLLINLKVPVELDSKSALAQQFNAELASLAGRNHLYQPQAGIAASKKQASSPSGDAGAMASGPMCTLPVKLGMIDTAIMPAHPALAEQPGRFSLQQQHFLPADIAPVYSHGTAVAGVLAAQHPDITPLLPKLTLYSAGAFYASNPYQQSATLGHLLQALNWLASQQVQVINMSLTGPENPVLATAIARLTEQQVVLVAAAGNAGPAAAPLFPAAYSQVLAVTAVDSQLQLYRWANQGDYIDYAALGVKVPALTANGDVITQSGTSLATPVVSAAVACLQAQQRDISLAQIRQHLTQQARDLGEPGKDSLFGYGLLSAPLKTKLK